MRLLTKLLCAILFTVVLGTGTAAYITYRKSAVAINDAAVESARLAAVEVSADLDQIISELKYNVALLTHSDVVQHLYLLPPYTVSGNTRKEFNQLVKFQGARFDKKRDAALFDLQGNMLLKTESLPSDIEYSKSEYFAAASRGEFVMSGPLFSEQWESFFLFVAVPVVVGEEIQGVAICTVDLAYVTSRVLSIRVGANGYCFVLDGQGNVIVHPHLATNLRVNPAGNQEWWHYSFGDAHKRAYVKKLSSMDWYVAATLSKEDLNVQAARMGNYTIMVNATLLAVISLVLFFIVRNITASLAQGVRFAKALSEGDFSHTLDVRRTDELGELADALRHMQYNLHANLENLQQEKEKAEEARQSLSTHKETLEEIVHARTKELYFAELKLRLLLNAVPDAIFGLNREGCVEFVNQAAVDMLGFNVGEQLPENIHALGLNAQRPEGKSPLFESFTKCAQADFSDSTVWRKDGTRLPADVSLHPIGQGDPQITSVLLVRDISRRHELEAEVQALYKTSADSYLIWDMQGQCLKISDDALRFFGAASRKHFTQRWDSFVLFGTPEESAPDKILSTAFESGFKRFECTLRDVRGLPIPCEVSLAPLSYQSQPALLCSVRDLRDLKRAEAEALAASEAKSEFLAVMSHELRTPLNGIMGMLQLARLMKDMRQIHNCLDTALDCSHNLLQLLSDILDICSFEKGTIQISPAPFTLEDLIQPVLGTLQSTAASKGLKFSHVIDPSLPAAFSGDVQRIRQILFNLVGNALKFTHKGEVYVELDPIVDDKLQLHPGVRICVRDTGVGIPEEKLPHLFGLFTQMDSSISRNYGGMGLGLPLVQRLTQLMNGELRISSVVGQGTEVWVDIPLEAPREEKKDAAFFSKAALQFLPLYKILAVAQSLAQLQVLLLSLRGLGCNPKGVTGDDKVLEALRQDVYDMVVFSVPTAQRQEDLEICRVIRRTDSKVLNPQIPIIVLTEDKLPEYDESIFEDAFSQSGSFFFEESV
ncbi:MAG: ATP-binding protein [Betaproteobacteria bacterium]|nr:ATP-binding protein [Betaproteobacteria bacterium]